MSRSSARLFVGALAACALSCGLTVSPAQADHAANLRAVLATVRLPPGFHISLYAVAPGARAMALSPNGKTLIVGTRSSTVYKVAVGGEAAAKVEAFAPDLSFTMPNGPCFAPDGGLFISEFNRVLHFAPQGAGWDEAHPIEVVKQNELVPPGETDRSHGARVCRIGPDGKLYVSVGEPYNVTPPEKQALYAQWGLGAIIRMDRDGSHREVFAAGIRDSVGMDFDPRDGALWFTDNQVDLMGDDTPPGEINKATQPGQNFGFPWYGGGHVRTREYEASAPPENLTFPEVEEVAHAADLGIIVYRGTAFPAEWRGLFSAQHGSWNRSVPVGARVMFTPVRDGKAGQSVPFAEGWNKGATPYLGRPVDVAELHDGSLIVSDDQGGALYRISYDGK